jgi:MscS family membrane protein
VILVVYFGFDIKSFDITKAFFILYVILFGTIIYRVTNLVASIKIEHIQTSRVLRKEVINLGIKVSNSVIVLLCALLILKILGVDLTALLSGLGIGGFALAFAAKDSIANIFGSISILASDMFEQGDWIEVGDIEGTVVEIGLRGTTIRTFDNALISIPNFKLANEGVKNWSRRSIGRRIKMLIGVTYESNFDDIKKAIEDIREMLKKHPDIANEHTKFQNPYRQAKLVSKEDFKGVKRTTMVYLDNFGDSSINILIYCFSRSVEWAEWLRVKEDVMYKIANILNQNNLEFAYPTMTIHKYEESRQ